MNRGAKWYQKEGHAGDLKPGKDCLKSCESMYRREAA